MRKIPWRREWPPTPLLLPGDFHGQRRLAGYSAWSHKETDLTEELTLSLFSKRMLKKKIIILDIMISHSNKAEN